MMLTPLKMQGSGETYLVNNGDAKEDYKGHEDQHTSSIDLGCFYIPQLGFTLKKLPENC